MIYALQRIWDKRHADLTLAGIEMRPQQNLIITPEKAIKLPDYTTTREIEKIINPFIKVAKLHAQQALQARQTRLL